MNILSERTQMAVKIVENWCTEVGLTVHPDKSETVIFTKNRNLTGFENSRIFGREIALKNEAKYLGIMLDSKLNWSKHIQYRLGKCLRIFWCCRSAIGKTWGLSPKNVLWIYNAIVKPMLAYGSFLWWYGTNTTTAKGKLSHLQRVACLAITGAMSTTPQAALEALLSLPKLDKYIEAEAKNTAYRLRRCITDAQHRYAKHTNILKALYNQNHIIESANDHIKTVYMFDRNYDVVIPQKTDWSNRLIKVNYYAHVYFTDGSVKNESSGYGALYTRDHVIMRGQCGKYAKITQSEIIAIHTCCIHAINNKLNGQICIYSDSIGALNALKSPKINSELVLECVRLLEQLTHSCKVSLIWLPAHNGIYGNEVADKIAKYAAIEILLRPEPLIAIEQPLFRNLTNTRLAQKNFGG